MLEDSLFQRGHRCHIFELEATLRVDVVLTGYMSQFMTDGGCHSAIIMIHNTHESIALRPRALASHWSGRLRMVKSATLLAKFRQVAIEMSMF